MTTDTNRVQPTSAPEGGAGVDRATAEVLQATRALVAEHDPRRLSRVEFRGAQFDAGLAWVQFPMGCGGLGLSPKLQTVVDGELREHGLSDNHLFTNPMGIGMGAPTIVAHGSTAMKEQMLRPIFTGEEIWCQLFSEPGAGSDVASLATRAVRDGDEWIVNGQKVWTTLAHIARWGMLVARTDPDQPKHRGLTYFIVDMQAPGVEVRPLRQATGEAEFNEVYFTDVRIPDAMRVGDVGKGWEVSITTLMNERVALGGGKGKRGAGPIQDLLRVWNERHGAGAGAAADPVMRDRVTRLWIEAEVLRLTNLRAGASRRKGVPGPEGSVGKLFSAELNKRIFEAAVDVLGAEGMLYDDYTMTRPRLAQTYGADVRRSFLRARANTIEGGTSEIMRNILGERVLGLPKEPDVSRDVPWISVPRS